MRKTFLLLLIICIFSMPSYLVAGPYGAEFVADAIQSMPQQQQERSAKMYVGSEGKRRIEYMIGADQVVDIYIPREGISRRLSPAKKTYMELPAKRTPSPEEAKANPCLGQANVTCKNLGREVINKREAVKWEIAISYKNQNATVLRWVDVDNGFPLIQKMPNGQKAEMRLVGQETVNGRSVEKWELISSWNQRTASSFQWYDPILKLAIREEGTGGMVNELRNIKAGPQPEKLFQVPAEYKKTEAPKQNGLKVVPVQ